MSIEKAEVKVGAANEIGNRMDDTLEGTVKDLHRLEGAAVALRQSVQSLEAVERAVDKEMDDGKFDLEVASHIKRFMALARQSLSQQAQQAEQNRIVQTGKVQAMQAVVKIVQKYRDEEANKARLLREAMERAASRGEDVESDEPRLVGLRPNATIKERRLAESRQATPEESLSEEAPTEEAPTEEATQEEPRRGRPKRR